MTDNLHNEWVNKVLLLLQPLAPIDVFPIAMAVLNHTIQAIFEQPPWQAPISAQQQSRENPPAA